MMYRLNWGATVICLDALESHKIIIIYCLNFLQNENIWKVRLCFILEVTCSVLSIGTLSVSTLLRFVFFTALEHDIVCESGMTYST